MIPSTFDQPTILAAIVAATGESAKSLAPIERAGAVNIVLVAVLESGRRVIVRVNTAGEHWRFEKEAWCIAQAQAIGVAAPAVLSLGSSEQDSWMIESELPGRSGDRIPSPDRPAVWLQIGTSLAKIHQIAVGGFGQTLAEMASGGETKWRRYLEYNLAQLDHHDPLLALGLLNPARQANLRAAIEQLARLQPRLGLSHGDLSLRNVIVQGQGATLIDWGCAEGHLVPHWDLGLVAGSVMPDDAPAFSALLTGYGLDQADYLAIRPNIERLRLLEATDKVRWALERNPGELPRLAARLRRTWRRLGNSLAS